MKTDTDQQTITTSEYEQDIITWETQTQTYRDDFTEEDWDCVHAQRIWREFSITDK